MANPEHVAIVRRGFKAVANWRRKHPDERLDLTGGDLNECDLSGTDLHDSDLSGAWVFAGNLQWATLGGANLEGAHLDLCNLKEATLKRARLKSASLINASLEEADLSHADLTNAILLGAALLGTTLRRANLRGALLTLATLDGPSMVGASFSSSTFGGNRFIGSDFGKAIGLGGALHQRPSSVGVDTLIASFRGAGNRLTPDLRTFFSGSGVPREMLDALPGIVSEIKYHTCFISYGQPDVKFAEKLREDLKGRGVDCWLYEKDKTVGKRTGHEIAVERRGAEKMVVLCSAKALVRDRFLEEIEDQINEDPNKMVPVSLDDLWKEPGFRVMRGTHDLKPDLVNRNYADFANKLYEEALAELLKGLRRP